MARRRGPLLLIAFLAAVMASGGGGVTAPWIPRPADRSPGPQTVAQVDPVLGGAIWRRFRME